MPGQKTILQPNLSKIVYSDGTTITPETIVRYGNGWVKNLAGTQRYGRGYDAQTRATRGQEALLRQHHPRDIVSIETTWEPRTPDLTNNMWVSWTDPIWGPIYIILTSPSNYSGVYTGLVRAHPMLISDNLYVGNDQLKVFRDLSPQEINHPFAPFFTRLDKQAVRTAGTFSASGTDVARILDGVSFTRAHTGGTDRSGDRSRQTALSLLREPELQVPYLFLLIAQAALAWEERHGTDFSSVQWENQQPYVPESGFAWGALGTARMLANGVRPDDISLPALQNLFSAYRHLGYDIILNTNGSQVMGFELNFTAEEYRNGQITSPSYIPPAPHRIVFSPEGIEIYCGHIADEKNYKEAQRREAERIIRQMNETFEDTVIKLKET